MEEAAGLVEGWRLGPLDKWKALAVSVMGKPKNTAAVARVAQELEIRRLFDGDMAGVFIEVADGDASEDDLARYLLMSPPTLRPTCDQPNETPA